MSPTLGVIFDPFHGTGVHDRERENERPSLLSCQRRSKRGLSERKRPDVFGGGLRHHTQNCVRSSVPGRRQSERAFNRQKNGLTLARTPGCVIHLQRRRRQSIVGRACARDTTDRATERGSYAENSPPYTFFSLSLSLGHSFVRDITHVGKQTQNSSLDSNFGLGFGNSGLAAVKAIL